MPDDLPPYLRIAGDLRAKIQAGDPGYLPGEKLPSTAAICDHYGVSSGTARQAVERIKREDLAEAHQGLGTFVRHRPPAWVMSLDRFARAAREEGRGAYDVELRAMGYQGRTEWLRLERGVASGDDGIGGQVSTVELLGVDPGSPVMIRARQMFAAPVERGKVDYQHEEVMQIATSFIPWDLAEQDPRLTAEDSGPGGILSRLADIGHAPVRSPGVARVRVGIEAEWELLRMRPPADVLTLDRRTLDAAGRVVEVCRHVMAPRLVALEVEYAM